MGGDGGHAQSVRRISPSSIKKDYGDGKTVFGGQGVVVDPCGRSSEDLWAMANKGVYTPETGHRSGTCGLSEYI